MNDTFLECHADLIALFPARDKEASVHRDACWDELKGFVPIIRQVFKNVTRTWKYKSLPTIKFIIDAKWEIVNGEKARKNWHKTIAGGLPDPNCNCDGCQLMMRAEENKCFNLKCDNDRVGYDEFCTKCHVIAKDYYCECNNCITSRDNKQTMEEENDLPF